LVVDEDGDQPRTLGRTNAARQFLRAGGFGAFFVREGGRARLLYEEPYTAANRPKTIIGGSTDGNGFVFGRNERRRKPKARDNTPAPERLKKENFEKRLERTTSYSSRTTSSFFVIRFK